MTQQQIQDILLSAELLAANKTMANYDLLIGGNTSVAWSDIRNLNRNINGLYYNYVRGDYTSDGTVKIYNCLSQLIGIDTTVNTIDPNYQPPSGTIIIDNPSQYLQPIVITWTNMSTDGSPDGGITRTTFYDNNWKGVNPFMALTSPALTGLELGTDYTLLPDGGFVLLADGNLPGIVDGQLITVYSYATA